MSYAHGREQLPLRDSLRYFGQREEMMRGHNSPAIMLAGAGRRNDDVTGLVSDRGVLPAALLGFDRPQLR
jgi:hypothetical protein